MMIFLRAVVLVMLGTGLAYFVAYAITGRVRYRASGLRVVRWTVVAGLVFFGILILENVTTLFR